MRFTILLSCGLCPLVVGAACRTEHPRFGAETSLPFDERPTVFDLGHRERLGVRDMAPARDAEAGGEQEPAVFDATVPAGWEALPATAMRQLNFRVAGSADAECYLTAGNLRGGALANANRWVSTQFGQAPMTQAQFEALPRHPLLGQAGALVAIEGSFAGMGGGPARDDFALLGIVAGGDDDLVTLKFTGPKAIVAAQRDAFLAFASSIRRAGSKPATGTPVAAATDGAGSNGFRVATPPGWQEVAPTDMRQKNWRIGADAECYLSAGNLSGGMLANANRWVSTQFGQPPLTQAQFDALPRHPLLGAPAVLVTAEGTFAGMGGGPGREGFQLLGLVGGSDADLVTLKFTGPKAVVEAQRAAFLQVAAALTLGAKDAPAPSAGADAGPHGGNPAAGAPTAGTEVAPFAGAIPTGWQPMGDTGSRLLRHRFGTKGECYVGQLGGDLTQMLGIWCGEMSAKTPDAAALAALPKLPMLGGEAVLLDLQGDYQGMGGSSLPGARSLVAALQQGTGITFVKCLGPAAEVEAQRANFLALVKSLRRNP